MNGFLDNVEVEITAGSKMNRARFWHWAATPPRLTFAAWAIAKIREIGEIQHRSAVKASRSVRQQPGFQFCHRNRYAIIAEDLLNQR